MAEPAPIFDVVIAGAGASGLALAAAVKQALGSGVSIAVVDPAPSAGSRAAAAAAHGRDRRGAAAAPRAHRRLGGDRAEGASHPLRWRSWTGRCATRCGCRISISTPKATGRSPTWRSTTMSSRALSALCDRLGVARVAASVARWAPGKRVAELGLSDGRVLRARLAVAADGARSKLRALADIPTYRLGLRPVRHRRDHRARARPRRPRRAAFPARRPVRHPAAARAASRASSGTSGAPTPARSSRSTRTISSRQLEFRFTPKLGEIRLASRVEAFPFRFQIARRFVGERLALVGDAAHVVHPIAGQGLNLGLRDVAALAETIVGEMRLGLDPGAPAPLAAYQRGAPLRRRRERHRHGR